ncbi:C-C chemokine receptor type 3-like [Rhinophrynus dorsalis]
MDGIQKESNFTDSNCIQNVKIFRIPHITELDCQLIDAVIAQVYPDLFYILSFVAIAANIIKVVITARVIRSWTTNQIYLINLAVTHILFILSCPAWGMYLSHQYDWHLGKYGCAVMNFISALGHCGSILFVSVICIDRMVTIYFPVASIQYKSVKCGKIVVITSWLLSTVIAILGYTYSTFSVYGGSKHFCGSMHISNVLHLKSIRSFILFAFPNLLIPSLFLVPCYVKIIIYLLSQQTRLPFDIGRAVKVDILYVSSFLVLCLPTGYVLLIICWVYLTTPACHDECTWARIINMLNETSRLLNICNAVISPLIYLSRSRLGQCTNLCDCSNLKLCSCDCSQQPPVERIPTVQLVYISCVTDDPDIKTGDCMNSRMK